MLTVVAIVGICIATATREHKEEARLKVRKLEPYALAVTGIIVFLFLI